MGGGKGGSSTTQNFNSGSSSTTIPPEVLARYNSVNAQAEQAAAQPFQEYQGQFVAPVNPTQQGGINTIAGAANSWDPAFSAAGGTLGQGLGAAVGALGQGQAAGTGLGAASLGLTGQAVNNSSPYNTSAGGLYGSSYTGAQPYNSAATGLAMAGTGAVNPSAVDPSAINQYLNPYESNVIGGTVAQLQNQFGQQQQALTGNQILSGSFGSDRGGIGKAVLGNQQDLALGSTVSGLLNSNYAQALAAAQQQQGVGLGAAQANRAALQQGAGQIASIGQQQFGQGNATAAGLLGTGNQIYNQGLGAANQVLNTGNTLFGQGNTAAGTYGNLGVSGAGAYQGLGTADLQNQLTQGQSQIGAGTVQQQTAQAQNQAEYNQFLQEQGYPFQVAQFLAGIAEGTGALSGSTTTSSGQSSGTSFSPQPFFSDERLKENIHEIGRTHDGQSIIRFNYKGSPHTQLGLSAQETVHRHPNAVGKDQGYLTVDYDAATRDAMRHHRADGGLVPRANMAGGGSMEEILAAQRQFAYPGAANAMQIGSGPRGMQLAPSGGHQMIQGPKVSIPQAPQPGRGQGQPQTGFGQDLKDLNAATTGAKDIGSLVKGGGELLAGSAGKGTPGTDSYTAPTGGLIGSGGSFSNKGWIDQQVDKLNNGYSVNSTAPTPSATVTTTPLPPPAGSTASPDPTTAQATPPDGLQPSPDVMTADASSVDPTSLDGSGGLDFAARGGRIGRAEGGGLPYGDDGYIPDNSDLPDYTKLVGEQKGMEGNAYPPAGGGSGPGGGSGGGSNPLGMLSSGVGIANGLNSLGAFGGAADAGAAAAAGAGALGSVGGMSAADALAMGIIALKRGGKADGLRPTFEAGGSPVSHGDEAPVEPSMGDALPPPDEDNVTMAKKAAAAITAGKRTPYEAEGDRVVPANDLQDLDKDIHGKYTDTLPAAPSGLAPAAAPATPIPATAAPTGLAPAPAPAPTPAALPPPTQKAPNAPEPPTQTVLPPVTPAGTPQKAYSYNIGNITTGDGKGYQGYATPQEGVAAAIRNAQAYPGRYNNGQPMTLQQIASHWAPADDGKTPMLKGNNPTAWAAAVAQRMNVDPNTPVNLTDPKMASLFAEGVHGIEKGAGTRFDPSVYDAGTRLAFSGKPINPIQGVAFGGGQGGSDQALNVPADGLSPAGGTVLPSTTTPGGIDLFTGKKKRTGNEGFFDENGWLDRNQREVTSGLAFLGNMLASPSHTLAGSVGSGLAAAAPMYFNQGITQQGQQQRQQTIGQEQERIDIANRSQLLEAWNRANQMQLAYISGHGGARDPGLDAQMQKIMQRVSAGGGFAPSPPGLTGGSGGPGSSPNAPLSLNGPPPKPVVPTSTGAQTAPAPAPPAPTNPPGPIATPPAAGEPSPIAELARKYGPDQTKEADSSYYEKLGDMNNPVKLRQIAQARADAGDKEGFEKYTAMANEAQERYGPVGLARKQMEDNRAWQTAEAPAQQSRKDALLRLQQMQDIVEKYQTGNLNDVLADATGIAKALHIDVPADNATDFQKFLKNAYGQILSMSGVQGTPTNALREDISHITPGPTLQPETNRSIIAQSRALIEKANNIYQQTNEGLAAEPRLNRGPFQAELGNRPENNLDALQKKYENEIAPLGDAPKTLDKAIVGRVYTLRPTDLAPLQQGQSLADIRRAFGGKSSMKFRFVEDNGQRHWVAVQ